MQKTPTSKKPIIIAIVIIILLILGYFYFSGSPTDTEATLEGGNVVDEGSVVGSQVLVLLNQISSIRIDPELFKAPVYKSLVDHTVTVVEQNVGRENPFAPAFGAAAAPVTPAGAPARTR